MFELPDISVTVAQALAEDLGVDAMRLMPGVPGSLGLLDRDVTASTVVGLDAFFSAKVVAREECVVCGLPVAGAVFEAVSGAAGLFEPVEFFPLVAEGASVTPGTPVAEVEGMAAAVLCAERTALDFLMILSGMATETARWARAAGPELAVCDTRKTLPGLRELSKYAVRVGGGTNHRTGLWDMVLVKDNHLALSGSITQAILRARAAHPDLLIEIEADTPSQALEAVQAGADMVLLDNMDDATLADVVGTCRRAAETRGRAVLLEASGGIRLERVAALRRLGVDRVSSSALTLAPPVDFGLDSDA